MNIITLVFANIMCQIKNYCFYVLCTLCALILAILSTTSDIVFILLAIVFLIKPPSFGYMLARSNINVKDVFVKSSKKKRRSGLNHCVAYINEWNMKKTKLHVNNFIKKLIKLCAFFRGKIYAGTYLKRYLCCFFFHLLAL